MAYHLIEDDGFWSQAPDHLTWTQVFAEAVGHRVASFVLGDDPQDPEATLALLMDLPPHWVLERHSHDCHRFEVVIRGSMIVDGSVLRPGSVSTSRPGESYGHHQAGPEGCLTLEMFSRQAGMPAQLDEPKPAAQGVQQLMGALLSGALTPAEGRKSPVIDEWVAEQQDEQERLRAEVAEREAAHQARSAQAS